LNGEISQEEATLGYVEMLALPVAFHPNAPFAERNWQLRNTVTPFDAWYVALAESLDAALGTTDIRLTRAPGPRCRFLTPPA
jgi:predicted nucleic acid-binding protein